MGTIESVTKKRKLYWQKYHEQSRLGKEPGKHKPVHLLDFNQKHYKGYPRLRSLPLPRPRPVTGISLIGALEKRHSYRDFTGKKVSLSHLSTVLHYSAGIKNAGTRYYPSAGGLYPLETYVLALNTTLPTGLYHYYLRSHLLEELAVVPGLRTDDYFAQSWLSKAAFILILTACIKRGLQKYSERSYRYMLLEAGHVGQTVSLITASLGLGSCPIGGFYDDGLNRLLDLEKGDEEVLYCIAVGAE